VVERETKERWAEVARQEQECLELEDECQLLEKVILERKGLEARMQENKMGVQARQLRGRRDALLAAAGRA
jgi:hypothetical protein